VIGINTAIYGPNGNIGIGFAMPINKAKAMLETIRSGKKVLPAARLGVSVDYLPGNFAERMNLPATGGLLVEEVSPGTPAQKAGLRGQTHEVIVGNYRVPAGGDLITAIDGKPVKEQQDVGRAISSRHAGDVLTLTLYRDGHSMDVKVTLAGEAEQERF
jgi:S1-C subfamily serine protease